MRSIFKLLLPLLLASQVANAANFVAPKSITTDKISETLIHGLTAVTPVAADYVSIADASDSNKNKKATVASLRNSVYRSVITTDAVGVDDNTMKLSGASFTSTLPTAVGVAGKRYKFVHAGTSTTQKYTIGTTSGQLIGSIAGGSYVLCTNGEVLEVESDGANWIITKRVTAFQANLGTITMQAVTTNPTKGGTPAVDVVKISRFGDRAKIRFEYRQTSSGTAGSGVYFLKMPTGYVIDSTKQTVVSNLLAANPSQQAPARVGSGYIALDGGGTGPMSNVYAYDTSSFVMVAFSGLSSINYITSSFYHFNNANMGFSVDVDVPIVDWQP